MDKLFTGTMSLSRDLRGSLNIVDQRKREREWKGWKEGEKWKEREREEEKAGQSERWETLEGRKGRREGEEEKEGQSERWEALEGGKERRERGRKGSTK